MICLEKRGEYGNMYLLLVIKTATTNTIAIPITAALAPPIGPIKEPLEPGGEMMIFSIECI